MTGALDVSSFRPDAEGWILLLAMAAVRCTARRIERAYFHECFPKCPVLTSPETGKNDSVPLLALDPDHRLVGGTRGACMMHQLDEAVLARSIGLSDLPGKADPPTSSFLDAERAVLAGALSQARGNVTAAAANLGISRATRVYGIRTLPIGLRPPPDNSPHCLQGMPYAD